MDPGQHEVNLLLRHLLKDARAGRSGRDAVDADAARFEAIPHTACAKKRTDDCHPAQWALRQQRSGGSPDSTHAAKPPDGWPEPSCADF